MEPEVATPCSQAGLAVEGGAPTHARKLQPQIGPAYEKFAEILFFF